MKDKILNILKNKKLWAALAISVAAAGGSVNPQVVVAVGEIVSVVIEETAIPIEPLPVQLAP